MTVAIRAEAPGDAPAITEVVREAFGGNDAEPKLVSLIRQRGEVLTSLVAVRNEIIIGHVLVSPIELDAASDVEFAGIAPLSVAVDYQGQGIGGMLMRAAIAASRKQGIAALFLLGSPQYYRRFGFVSSHIGNEYGATDSFMHFEILPGCLQDKSGVARYVSAFQDAGA
jgi:putative acetyltransferase